MKATTMKSGEVAKELGVTTVTVRSYANRFNQFLSPGASETSRKFTPEDVKVLKLGNSLLRSGYTFKETIERIKEQLPVAGDILEDVEPHQEPPEPPPGEPRSIQPMEFFSQFLERLTEEHQLTLQAKDTTIETLQADKARLQAENAWLHLPFFIRWFRKPPG